MHFFYYFTSIWFQNLFFHAFGRFWSPGYKVPTQIGLWRTAAVWSNTQKWKTSFFKSRHYVDNFLMFLCKLLVDIVFPHFCFVALALLAGFATSCGFFSSLLTMFLSCPAAPCTYITSQFYNNVLQILKWGLFSSVQFILNCVYNVCACVRMFIKMSYTGLLINFVSRHVTSSLHPFLYKSASITQKTLRHPNLTNKLAPNAIKETQGHWYYQYGNNSKKFPMAKGCSLFNKYWGYLG